MQKAQAKELNVESFIIIVECGTGGSRTSEGTYQFRFRDNFALMPSCIAQFMAPVGKGFKLTFDVTKLDCSNSGKSKVLVNDSQPFHLIHNPRNVKVLEGWKTTHGSYIPNTLENDLVGRQFPCVSNQLEIKQNFIEIHFNLNPDEEFSMKLQHIDLEEGYDLVSVFISNDVSKF